MLQKSEGIDAAFASDADKERGVAGFYEAGTVIEIEAKDGVFRVQAVADAGDLLLGHWSVRFVVQAFDGGPVLGVSHNARKLNHGSSIAF